MKKLILFLLLIITTISWAQDHVGTIIRLQGDVNIYLHHGNSLKGDGPYVLLDQKYYTIKKAKLGNKINEGDLVITGNKSKVRIVFKNGDQFNVGEGTAYNIQFSKHKFDNRSGSIINLLRGKLRAVISPVGPRNSPDKCGCVRCARLPMRRIHKADGARSGENSECAPPGDQCVGRGRQEFDSPLAGPYYHRRAIGHDLVGVLHELAGIEAHGQNGVGAHLPGVLLQAVHGLVAAIVGQFRQHGDLTAEEGLAPGAGGAQHTAAAHRDAPAGPDDPLDLKPRRGLEGGKDGHLVNNDAIGHDAS